MDIHRKVFYCIVLIFAISIERCLANPATITLADTHGQDGDHMEPDMYQDEMRYLHDYDHMMGDVFENPNLSEMQLRQYLYTIGNATLEKYFLTEPGYLTMGLLKQKNVDMLEKIAETNFAEGTSPPSNYGWSYYQSSISQRDIDWFKGYDKNVSQIYGIALSGCDEWVRNAVRDFGSYYVDMRQNTTRFQETVEYMNDQYHYGLNLHYLSGTETGLKSDTKSSSETFALVINILNFIFNLINLIGLVAFLIIKRRVGASAVLDTEMTFPSSPTAQI